MVIPLPIPPSVKKSRLSPVMESFRHGVVISCDILLHDAPTLRFCRSVGSLLPPQRCLRRSQGASQCQGRNSEIPVMPFYHQLLQKGAKYCSRTLPSNKLCLCAALRLTCKGANTVWEHSKVCYLLIFETAMVDILQDLHPGNV